MTENITINGSLPNDKNTEALVLGVAIINEVKLDEIISKLTEADFYNIAHQKIFSAIKFLHTSNDHVSLVTLKNRLRANNDLDECGGVSYLAELTDNIITSTNINTYINILKNDSTRRELIKKSVRLAQLSYDKGTDNGQLMSEIDSISNVGNLDVTKKPYYKINDLSQQCTKMVEDIASNKDGAKGLQTGFSDLDSLLCGIVTPDMFVLAARPSCGKTSFSTMLAKKIAENGKNVLFFTLETSKEQLVLKMAIQNARINSHELRSGNLNDSEWVRFADSLAYLSELPIMINDESVITPVGIRNVAKTVQRECGPIGLIIVDYLQMVSGGQRHDNRTQEVSYVSRSIKMLGKDFNCPTLLLSQLSREVERRNDKRPQMSDLRESGAIEQDADIIGFLYRDEIYDPDTEDKGIAELIIRKHRNGPLGFVKLAFLKESMRFESLARCNPF